MSALRVKATARSVGTRGVVGAVILGAVVLLAVVGPLFAPHSPTAPVGAPGLPPSTTFVLGTDDIGRDVLSRALYGGRTLIWAGALTTLLAYALGGAIGLLAGYARGLVDTIVMRMIDVFLVLPGIMVLLLILSGLGTSMLALIMGGALVQFPSIARFVRTAALEVSVQGYVEAAAVRGESGFATIRREVLPNIMSPIIADIGIRFTFSILLLAAANYLGLGLQPPTADWALMIGENREIVSFNVAALLAPAALIALLTIGLNLLGDGIAHRLGESRRTTLILED